MLITSHTPADAKYRQWLAPVIIRRYTELFQNSQM